MTIGDTPRVGVSSCLLGEEVRYDGGHKRNDYVSNTLADHLDLVPWCPEMAIGLGVPRPPIRLIRRADEIRAVRTDDTSVDVTDKLAAYGREVSNTLGDLSGYILKKDSPSCGMERVRVYNGSTPDKSGTGIYARVIMEAHPHLPTEEEGRLNDPRLRENFIERVFTLHRWQKMVQQGLTPRSLVAFHTEHKFLILAHDEPGYRELGRLISQAGGEKVESLGKRYLTLLMQTLSHHATPKKHANVLMHIMGFFKDKLDASDKAELLEQIDAHREGLVPVIVPITLINHYLRKFPETYIERQIYLSPHPRELMLRNHV
ncbi:MAG TPA: DUF523 and DUF1722 domain-containing protein [Pseudomonadales bacterium]|nr:DUF523 and DUF1722 domain-containing protein [Pseudomonadales bacterium]